MRKKILSAFMLGALVVAATSTMTSCKDYDGDIAELQEQVNKNAQALSEAKAALEAEISGLKTQLETLQSKHDQDVDKLETADEANKKAIADEVLRAEAAEEALEKRIETAEKALEDLQALMNTKVDNTTFEAEVQKIYARIESVETDLGAALTRIDVLEKGLKDEETAREAAVKNLQDQIDVLDGYKSRVEANEKAIKALDTTVGEITKKIDAIKEDLKAALEDIKANAKSIDDLTKKMNTLNSAVENLYAEVSVLKVLVSTSLRSIVFEPSAYYWGVEATESFNLNYNVWALPAADADKAEEAYSSRVENVEGSTNLPVVASYFMNPSSADLSKATVNVLSDDKQFVTRAAAAGISVSKWATENGKLNVTLKFADPAAIKSVLEDKLITVFATQVNLSTTEGKDTTITSDFAAIYASTIYDPQIAVINPANGESCDLVCNPAHSHPHIYATEDAAGRADAQYQVKYNGTIDLAELVETHYNEGDQQHAKFDAEKMEKYGLKYKYELVGYFKGDNMTSESAHAAIKGSILRAQMPKFNEDHTIGKAAGYEETEQSKTEIGREPMVRVSLIDTNNDNRVIDYGYIKLVITDENVAPGEEPFKEAVMAPFAPITYNFECHPTKYVGELNWSQVEKAIYNLYGLSRDDFNANFTPDFNAQDNFKQYVKVDGKWVVATKEIGVISHVEDPGSAMTEIAKWTIDGDELKALLSGEKAPEKFEVAFRYASNDITKYGDIYVVLSTGKITVNKPNAVGLVNANKIAENWYATNSSTAKSGWDEVHAQTVSPEDPQHKAVADVLNYNIYNVFVGNKITIADITDHTAGKEFADTELTKDVKFSALNNGKVYTGTVNGENHAYTMQINADANKLQVVKIDGIACEPVTVAKIEDDIVKYQHGAIAEGLLNYKAHNQLADDVLTAIMEVSAANDCFPLPLTQKTWNVRFLRPINVFGANAEVTDAATEAQVINLVKLVSFTDWRDEWNDATYYAYYNIKKIEVLGAEAGENIAPYVYTNLNQAADDFSKTLSDVSNKIRLTYEPKTVTSGQTNTSDYGTIVYPNQENTTGDFIIRIPVAVTYEWGKVVTKIDLKVNKTIGGNGAKRK